MGTKLNEKEDMERNIRLGEGEERKRRKRSGEEEKRRGELDLVVINNFFILCLLNLRWFK